ncbi:MAG: hypothetical protein ACOX05_01990 [Bacillota bacterium]
MADFDYGAGTDGGGGDLVAGFMRGFEMGYFVKESKKPPDCGGNCN